MLDKPLGRTIYDHLKDALDWFPSKYVDPLQMHGWRPTCYVLAKEVIRLNEELALISDMLHEAITKVNLDNNDKP